MGKYKETRISQPVEQAGFISGFSTNDNFQVMRTLIDKCKEYKIPMVSRRKTGGATFTVPDYWVMQTSLHAKGKKLSTILDLRQIHASRGVTDSRSQCATNQRQLFAIALTLCTILEKKELCPILRNLILYTTSMLKRCIRAGFFQKIFTSICMQHKIMKIFEVLFDLHRKGFSTGK